MAYETKVLLMALAEVAVRTNSKEVYMAIARMANVEGMIIKPFEDMKTEVLGE